MSERPKGWDKVEQDIERGPLGLFKWVAIGVISLCILIGGISLISRPANVAIDRVIQKQSFQYKEGMRQQAAIWEAQIIDIDADLAKFAHDAQKVEELQNQKKVIQARLRAVMINQ